MDVAGHRVPVMDVDINDGFLQATRGVEVKRRLVLVDTANIIHQATLGYGQRKENEKLDAGCLLSLVRFFIKNHFKVVLVVPHKYTKKAVVENVFIIERLIRLRVATVLESHNYDDTTLLEWAHTTDGVIVSRDQFKTELEEFNISRYRTIATEQTVKPIFEKRITKIDEMCCMSRNGHFIYDSHLTFRSVECLNAVFFSKPASPYYELIEPCYAGWTEQNQQYIMEELDKLVIDLRVKMGLERAPDGSNAGPSLNSSMLNESYETITQDGVPLRIPKPDYEYLGEDSLAYQYIREREEIPEQEPDLINLSF